MYKRLGEILLAEEVINTHQLQAALAASALWGRRVGEILVSRRECTEQQILEALSKQLGVEAAPLSKTATIPEQLLSLIPGDLAQELQVLPFSFNQSEQILEIALADPTDQDLLDELRFLTGLEIRPFVALASELSEAIKRFYQESVGIAQERGEPFTRQEGLRGDEIEEEQTLPEFIQRGEIDPNFKLRLETLESSVSGIYGLLKELSLNQDVLLGMLCDRGLLNRQQFERRLKEAKSRKEP